MHAAATALAERGKGRDREVVPAVRRFTPSAEQERGALSAALHGELFLLTSSYPNRRATLWLRPFDRPSDEEDGAGDSNAYVEVAALQPSMDGVPHAMECACSRVWCADAAESSILSLKALTAAGHPVGPYAGRPLEYITSEDAVPFSALLTTLRCAGFTRIVGRAGLLNTTWSLRWIKRPTRSDFLAARPDKYQKVNHFPGAWRLGRKDSLHQQLKIAAQRWARQAAGATTSSPPQDEEFSQHYFPEGWVIPDDAAACQLALRAPENAGRRFIVKPVSSACGRGISLLRGGKSAEVPLSAVSADVPVSSKSRFLSTANATARSGVEGVRRDDSLPARGEGSKRHSRLVVQCYVENPFLIDGRKFDLRLYVVITSYAPVRMYLYREGLVRFASRPFHADSAADRDDLAAHLTNFTIQKNSGVTAGDAHGVADSPSSQEIKCGLAQLKRFLQEAHTDGSGAPLVDWPATQRRLHDLLVKTFLSCAPEVRDELEQLAASSSSGSTGEDAPATEPPLTFRGVSPFFQFYGVDVLLCDGDDGDGSALRPVLMEVNIMPSLSTHYSLLDQRIKGNFIADALTLVGLATTAIKPSRANVDLLRAGEDRDGDAGHAGPPGFHEFLAALPGRAAQEACLTAEEERCRAPHFVALMPTADSFRAYNKLLNPSPVEAASAGADHVKEASPLVASLDDVLSRWAAWRKSAPCREAPPLTARTPTA